MTEAEIMISQKKAEIRKLQDQIKELEMPKTLYDRVDGKLLLVTYDGEVKPGHFSGNEPWNLIKKLGLELYRPKKDLHRREHMTIKHLTYSEAEVVADMASEMIEVWNRYVKWLYAGGEKE